METKYQPAATRRNLNLLADYQIRFEYSNGLPVLFDTAKEATQFALEKCANPAYGLYNPCAIPVNT